MSVYMFLYMVSIALYGAGIVVSCMAWIEGGDLFCGSSIKNLIHNDLAGCIERDFLAVLSSVVGNSALCFAMAFYLIEQGGHSVGWIEPFFLLGHITTGCVMLYWHYNTYLRVKKISRSGANTC